MGIFNRIKASYQSRVVINRMTNAFEKTEYGKEIARFKGAHKGEKCFVLGNGPSLSPKDLETLEKNGIPTFAANRIFNIFDKTDWRPTYYVCEDIDVIRDIKDKVAAVECKTRFMPINLKWYENYDIPGTTYFLMDYKSSYPDNYGFNMDLEHSIRCRATVTVTAIQLAIYMGFKEIYLLGVDNSFSKMIDKHGNLIVDKSINDHFDNNYSEGVEDKGFRIDTVTEAYIDIESLSDKLNSFRVYNATRGGRLEVFERVNFDELFAQ